MITLIDGLPSNVVGLKASGHVEASDYTQVLDPALDSALATHDKVRFLYVLGSDFHGYSGAAMWEDTKVGVEHWTRFEKIAFVTDDHAYHDAVKALAWLMPAKVTLYTLSELDSARQWIAE